ncbi:MAG TPA: RNase adapter RapZ [Clostridiaceae bacterium]|nr:RNase adapter RapZ [Clostridiaceae bacterium]
MNITIVTGLSGSGKSLTANLLEDMGFFCIDNMPPQLIAELTRVLAEWQATAERSATDMCLALVMDTRTPGFVKHLHPVLDHLRDSNVPVRILFLETSDAALISRYNQSRRDHPLAHGRSLSEAIASEREMLAPVKALATDIIDTTSLSRHDLRQRLQQLFSHTELRDEITIFVQSFGFKYGIPPDADIVCDVRFLPNPHYIDHLRPLSGLDQPVIDFLKQYPEADEYLERQCELFDYTIPFYIREGKQRLNIGIGCTGGRHRSVMSAERIADHLKQSGYNVIVLHRDLHRDVRQRQIDAMEATELYS